MAFALHLFLPLHLNKNTSVTDPFIHLEDKVKVWADGIDKPQNMMVYPRIALRGKMVTNPNATAIYQLGYAFQLSFCHLSYSGSELVVVPG